MKITELTLATPHPDEMKKFYTGALGFAEIEASSDTDGLSFQAGHTRVNFIPGDRDAKYHFAFNIKPDQLNDAVKWMNNCGVELVFSPEDKGVIVDFPNWWAKSIYFFDPAGNIVELIARGGIGTAGNAPAFSAGSIVGISEIGIVTDDVVSMREWIINTHGISPFPRQTNSEQFSALGDDHGLILIAATGRNWFMGNFPAAHFPVSITCESDSGVRKLLLP
jgi:catechol-2,3-dioxygenase